MKALQLVQGNIFPQILDIEKPIPKSNQVILKLAAFALNHRDHWIAKGLYPGIKLNTTLGSDGFGIIDGRNVIVNPALYWGENQNLQSPEFEVLGMPTYGTFADYIAIDRSSLFTTPAHLSPAESAALPLAGLTAYRSLFSKGKLLAGEKVLISGIGGGVALFAMQFAIAAGAHVWVTSSEDWKIEKAKSLGAIAGINYNDNAALKEMARSIGDFDLIIDGACGYGFKALIDCVAPGGRLVFYGATKGNPGEFNAAKVFWRQISIIGSTMGSAQDFQSMVDFVETHKIRPVIDSIFSFSDYKNAFERMANGLQFGKIIMTND